MATVLADVRRGHRGLFGLVVGMAVLTPVLVSRALRDRV